ncbi:MAG: 4-phosphoerythronate dehydrogenase [Bacteroides sp.]|nr:4-phosphoerythronate dehydrogenase [Bacteroides sp.]MCM1413045.1 4-phosphoerythronate dehydrogenase [Bacteroides sp.]MCM1471751.1 4-phosphoerythronate dehydrogenase [Bacteroides sp.]
MKVIVEANIPFIRGLLEPMAEVVYLTPEQTTPEAVADADALITRTRTRCDASLLEGSRVKLIASATIGLDHVDLDYCRSAGIEVVNAPGCNAPAVAQYVMASILTCLDRSDLSDLTLGVVGVGHVGSIVARWASALGMRVLLCDPPRARVEGPEAFVDLDTVAREADIITFHTPFTCSGRYATRHLASADFFALLRRRPMIINSARGPIVDTQALLSAIAADSVGAVAIDCWEGEPDISLPLLSLADIATPHIAGYSRQGKIRASQMAVNAVAARFGFDAPVIDPSIPMTAPESVSVDDIRRSYNPLTDTRMLRRNPAAFEDLRNSYHLREEL